MTIRNSVAGAPLVQALTPYTLLDTADALPSDFPPSVDFERLQKYQDYEALIENRPYDVFDDLQLKAGQQSKIVLALALPELICNVWADSVWNDPPTLEFGQSKANDRWQQFVRENDVEQRAWESVFSAGFRGTSVVHLIRDDDQAIEPIRWDEVSAAIFFPTLKKGSDREFESVTLAWEEDRGDGGARDRWQVRELHLIENGTYVIHYQERRATRAEGGWNETKFERTDLDFLPFVDLHGARWSGRYWGVSELARIMSITDEVDNRLSDIAEVLEYHGKPVLQVPSSLVVNGVLQKGADRTFSLRDPEMKDVARYITYDAMIDSQIAALDRLLDLALLTCEVPSTYFGIGVEGSAPTGVAMKLRLQNYLKKAARWQRRETTRLRTVGEFLMRIDGEGVSNEQARDSKVMHGSPLPADDEQEARIESLLTGGEVLSSRRTSISRLRRVDDVDEELALIDQDAAQAASGAPSGTPTPQPTGLAAAGVTLDLTTPQSETTAGAPPTVNTPQT